MKKEKTVRKYVRSGKYSKKNKFTMKELTPVETEIPSETNLSGLTIRFSPDYLRKIKVDQLHRIESEFRNTVLDPFDRYVERLRKEDCGTDVQLSKDSIKNLTEYSRELDKEEVLIPQSEFPIRCHLGLKLTMEWSIRRILELERELSKLKKSLRNVPLELNRESPQTEDIAPTTDKSSSEQFFVTE